MLVLLFAIVVSVQGEKKLQIPDTLGVFYLLDSSKNTLTPLERQIGRLKASGLMVRYGRAKSELEGEKATLRVKSGQKQEFLLHISLAVDPNKYVLHSLVVKKGKREASNINPILLPCNVTQYDEGSYVFIPVKTLPPGEYAFSPVDSSDAFCFGVDAPSPDKTPPMISSASEKSGIPDKPTFNTTKSAKVTITSEPSGAEIELNGDFVGSTPTTLEVLEGSHELAIKSGSRIWRRSIKIHAGSAVTVTAAFDKLTSADISEPAKKETKQEPNSEESPKLSRTSGTPEVISRASIPIDVHYIDCGQKPVKVLLTSKYPLTPTKLKCGEEVTVLSTSGQWTFIRTKDNVEGQVSSRFIRKKASE